VDPIRAELVKAGLVVEIHDDHFSRDEEDCVWLAAAGERGWVVLTKDQKLRYRPLEISALRASKARVFVLTAGNLRASKSELFSSKRCRRFARFSRAIQGLLWPASQSPGKSQFLEQLTQ
jgi:predicted nuclease of predicted toxin-antitoxin system